jgi:hypothetical protein
MTDIVNVYCTKDGVVAISDTAIAEMSELLFRKECTNHYLGMI